MSQSTAFWLTVCGAIFGSGSVVCFLLVSGTSASHAFLCGSGGLVIGVLVTLIIAHLLKITKN